MKCPEIQHSAHIWNSLEKNREEVAASVAEKVLESGNCVKGDYFYLSWLCIVGLNCGDCEPQWENFPSS